jgi:hypothetical protein
MFSNNNLVDEKWLLTIIAVGTLLIYIIVPTPNVLYREENKNNDIMNFGENTDCYGVKTTEIECPIHSEPKNENFESDIPHNYNMHIESE